MARETGRVSAADPAHGWSPSVSPEIRKP